MRPAAPIIQTRAGERGRKDVAQSGPSLEYHQERLIKNNYNKTRMLVRWIDLIFKNAVTLEVGLGENRNEDQNSKSSNSLLPEIPSLMASAHTIYCTICTFPTLTRVTWLHDTWANWSLSLETGSQRLAEGTRSIMTRKKERGKIWLSSFQWKVVRGTPWIHTSLSGFLFLLISSIRESAIKKIVFQNFQLKLFLYDSCDNICDTCKAYFIIS